MNDLRNKMINKFNNIKWTSSHVCGIGSIYENTQLIRTLLKEIVDKEDIHKIADIGAGLDDWIRSIEFNKKVEIKSYDLVPRVKNVHKFDITKDSFDDKFDLLLIRYVLNHIVEMPELHLAAINNIKNSGSKYLLMTSPDSLESTYKEYFGEPLLIVPEQIIKNVSKRSKWSYYLWDLRRAQ